jgi:RNA recognition motif-containing protein
MVGNIPYSMDETAMQAIFVPFGPVLSARIAREKDGRSKGYGFVDMPDTDGETAIQALNGTTIGGRVIHVTETRPRPLATPMPVPPAPDEDFS